MSSIAKSALTLIVLAALLVGGGVWGFSALTAPLPVVNDPPPCDDWTAKAGTKLYPDQVTVSVYNAGTREGLAGRTSRELIGVGFAEGVQGNTENETKVKVATAQVWAPAEDDPAALLIASYLGDGVEIVARDDEAPGIVVVVGDKFTKVAKGKKSVKVAKDTVVCSPLNAQEETEPAE